MLVQTILNHVEEYRSSVYESVVLERERDAPRLLVSVRARTNSRPLRSEVPPSSVGRRAIPGEFTTLNQELKSSRGPPLPRRRHRSKLVSRGLRATDADGDGAPGTWRLARNARVLLARNGPLSELRNDMLRVLGFRRSRRCRLVRHDVNVRWPLRGTRLPEALKSLARAKLAITPELRQRPLSNGKTTCGAVRIPRGQPSSGTRTTFLEESAVGRD